MREDWRCPGLAWPPSAKDDTTEWHLSTCQEGFGLSGLISEGTMLVSETVAQPQPSLRACLADLEERIRLVTLICTPPTNTHQPPCLSVTPHGPAV